MPAVAQSASPYVPPAAPTERQPNIIMIFTDDMGYGDAGCYGDTNLVPTPNIDRIADEGVRFTQGYVTCPACAPSRYGLLTGMYQQKLGIYLNEDAFHYFEGWEEESLEHNRIPDGQRMVNQTLADAGYTTALVGKSNMPCYPQTSFHESWSVIEFQADYFPDENGHFEGVNEPKAGPLDVRYVMWGPEREGDEYLTDRLGRESVDFIRRHQHDPFFLYLAFNAPHSPMQAKRSHLPQVEHLESESLKFYGAMMLSVDENVGHVLDALDELGLAENTIVAFSSDNGPTHAFRVGWPEDWPRELLGSAGPLRGHKGQDWEGGIRVPYMMRWPAQFEAGQVYDQPVSTLDFYPTFAAAAGAEIPATTQIDGTNLLPYLSGEETDAPHDILFWHRGPSGAVRQGPWKLIEWEGHYQLFNLDDDLAETTDLASEHPDVLAELVGEYQAFVDTLPPPLNHRLRANRAAAAEAAAAAEEAERSNQNREPEESAAQR